MIDIQGLTVRIGEKRVLRDVNLRIETGRVVVLFGPNGCGKTSLLKTIMGGEQYRVESGRILFKGEDITGLAIDERARLGIGMAFQRPPAVSGVKLGEILRKLPGEKTPPGRRRAPRTGASAEPARLP